MGSNDAKRMVGWVFGIVLLASCQLNGPTAVEVVQPTYSDIASRVFSTCSTRSCHGALGAKGGLQLTSDVAYAQLVNVPAENSTAARAKKIRVVPGDPANSFLMQKLEGPAPDEGDLMPQRGEKLPEPILAAIRTWIANGAAKETPAVKFHL